MDLILYVTAQRREVKLIPECLDGWMSLCNMKLHYEYSVKKQTEKVKYEMILSYRNGWNPFGGNEIGSVLRD